MTKLWRRRASALLATLLALLLAACASVGERRAEAVIAPDLTYAIPPPAALGRQVQLAQMITARYGDQSFSFEGHLSVEDQRLLLVALDGFGRRAFRIEWAAGTLSFAPAPWLPSALRAENMLADITLIYWPEESVRQALGGAATLLTEPRARTVRRGNDALIHIDYHDAGTLPWARRVTFRNEAFGYELEIQSVAMGG